MNDQNYQNYQSNQPAYGQVVNQQSPYSNQTSGNLPSPGFLKKMEWWIAGLGWGNCVVAIIMFAVMISMFWDPEAFERMEMTGNANAVMFSSIVYLICYVMVLLMGLAVFVLSIIDMVQVNKVTQRFVGLLLFFLFCRPGYIIWREHILGQKKTLGIINIIVWALYFIIAFVMVFAWMFKLMAGTM